MYRVSRYKTRFFQTVSVSKYTLYTYMEKWSKRLNIIISLLRAFGHSVIEDFIWDSL